MGRILGKLGTTEIKFRARKVIESQEKETLYYRLERFLTLDHETLSQFRGIIATNEGTIFLPPLNEVKDNVFIFVPLVATKQFSAGNSSLIDDEGYILGWSKWQSLQTVFPGDSLIVTHKTLKREEIRLLLSKDRGWINDQLVYRKTRAMRVE